MKRVLTALILSCIAVSPALALFDSANGGQPGEYLDELSGGARGMALGLAQVALYGQANLLYSNPAGISGIWWKEASFNYVPLFAQSQYATLSYACPVGDNNTLGVSFVRLASGDAEKTNALGEAIGTFSDQETAVIIGAAVKLSKEVSCGLSVKMVSQDIDTLSEKGFGADLGLIYRYSPGHTWGLALVNAVSPILGPDRFPTTVKGGFSHVLFRDFSWHGEVSGLNLFSGDFVSRYYTGFEFNRPEWFFWRLGLNEKQLSAGFGIGSKQIDIDYAFIYNSLDTVHNISVNIRYGYPAADAELAASEKIEEMKKQKEELAEAERKEEENIKFERERLNREKKLALKFMEARRAFDEKRYVFAQERLQEILKEDPAYDEAKTLSSEIKSRVDSENVVRRLEYARQAYKKGAFSEAKEHAGYVLELQTDNVEARVILFLASAQVYLSNKQYKEAKGELIEVLKIEPNNPEASQLLKRVQNILDVYGGQ